MTPCRLVISYRHFTGLNISKFRVVQEERPTVGGSRLFRNDGNYLSTYLPAYLPTCIPTTCLPTYLPAYLLPACLPTCIPTTCLPACLPTCTPTTCLPTCIHTTCMPAYLPAYLLPACLPTYLHTYYLPTYPPTGLPCPGGRPSSRRLWKFPNTHGLGVFHKFHMCNHHQMYKWFVVPYLQLTASASRD